MLGAKSMATNGRMSRVICQKRNFPTPPFFFGPSLWLLHHIQSIFDWLAESCWDVLSNPVTESVSGFLHSAAAALAFQFAAPTGWCRRGAGSAPFSMGFAGN
jgi:hypothetical protein